MDKKQKISSRQKEIDKITNIILDCDAWLYADEPFSQGDMREVIAFMVDSGIRSASGFEIDNEGFPTEGIINPIDYTVNENDNEI